jgi:hypothetical protein
MKQSKELVVGFIALSALLAESFKDGVQVADLAAIFAKIQADQELQAKLIAAYQDIELVKEELKDVSAVEVVEVLSAALPEIMKLLQAVKK